MQESRTTGTPRWVKVGVAITLIVLAVVVVLLVTGRGGDHGPGRHSGDGEHRPPAAHTQP